MLNRDRTIMRKDWGSRGVESILITSDLSGKKVGKTLVFSLKFSISLTCCLVISI